METPMTLTKAIKNGMWIAAKGQKSMPEEIEKNVVDFLNQTLTVVSLEGHEDAVKRIVEIIEQKKRQDKNAA